MLHGYFGIIVRSKLKGTHKDHWAQLLAPGRATQKSDHMTNRVVQVLLQTRCHEFGSLGSLFHSAWPPLGEEPFSDMQLELPLSQLQVIVGSNKVSPKPPLLQRKQFQLLLVRPVLQTSLQLCCLFLDMLQDLSVSLVVRSPKLNIGCSQCLPVVNTEGWPLPLLPLWMLFLLQARIPLAF